MSKKSEKVKLVVVTLCTLLAFYLLIASTVYRYRHPEMTETQLSIHLWDAITWRP
jgi:hypothetical protein